MQRLKEMNIDLGASTICQRCLEQAIAAEEKALTGDRLARVVARLRSTKTLQEQVADEAEAIGRRWAEDVAALAELRKVAVLVGYLNLHRLDVSEIARAGSHVRVEFVQWTANDNVEPWQEPMWLAGSIPIDDIARIAQHEGISYISTAFASFCGGAAYVLDAVEEAMRRDGEEVPARVIPGDIPF
jgi:hypothetical protein